MRKIPAAMATQHPDNAFAPYWLENTKFVDTKHEVEECYRSFNDLNCGEYMWDWEGKHVDEAVMEKLLERHGDFFSKTQLGKDVFLTFRIPNFWLEKGYRVARALVNIMSANDLAKDQKLHTPPIFEAILPMTQSGEQLYFLRKNYTTLAKALRMFGEAGPQDLGLIPLFEAPDQMTRPDEIMADYLKRCAADPVLKKRNPEYFRPFIGRSDPALNSGLAPAILKAKITLSRCYSFEQQTGLPVYPIIGVGGLPFRGGLTPQSVASFCKEYEGVRTATVQSSFRYDYPKEEVKKAIGELAKRLTKKAPIFDKKTEKELRALDAMFETFYKKTIETISDDVMTVSKTVPQRRERRLHIGLFGYARKVSGKILPRAIGFTCAMYSLGVPPEFIATGRGLESAKQQGLFETFEQHVELKEKLEQCGGFLNKQNLAVLAQNNAGWKAILKDVAILEDWFDLSFGPKTEEHLAHKNLSTNLRLLIGKGQDVSKEMERMAELRKSVG